MAAPVTFGSLGLDARIAAAVDRQGFREPTEVQARMIPLVLKGHDVLARARTGSGKTAAYAIPVLQKLLDRRAQGSVVREFATTVLVLVPTKELAKQASTQLAPLMHGVEHGDVTVTALHGGGALAAEAPALQSRPDVVIGTPARILEHHRAGNVVFTSLDTVVIDEADLMASYGYKGDMSSIAKLLPHGCQALILSATLAPDDDELKMIPLSDPVVLEMEQKETDYARKLRQCILRCADDDKFLIVYALLKLRLIQGRTILFVEHVDRCYMLKLFLDKFGIKAAVLNPELPLNSRVHILEDFNRGQFDYLIITDATVGPAPEDEEEEEAQKKNNGKASKKNGDDDDEEDDDDDEDSDAPRKKKKNKNKKEQKQKQKPKQKESTKKGKKGSGSSHEYSGSRGVDFRGVKCVVNFDMPASFASYTHRIGRTARGTASGTAISLVGRGDEKLLAQIEARQEDKYGQVLLEPYEFNLNLIEGFRYRVQDVLRGVTKFRIKQARVQELKQEILNSEKLKSHFEDNPQDLQLLRHDRPLQEVTQPHLKTVPKYLVPKVENQAPLTKAEAPNPALARKRKFTGGRSKRSTDPLSTFSQGKRKGKGRGKGRGKGKGRK